MKPSRSGLAGARALLPLIGRQAHGGISRLEQLRLGVGGRRIALVHRAGIRRLVHGSNRGRPRLRRRWRRQRRLGSRRHRRTRRGKRHFTRHGELTEARLNRLGAGRLEPREGRLHTGWGFDRRRARIAGGIHGLRHNQAKRIPRAQLKIQRIGERADVTGAAGCSARTKLGRARRYRTERWQRENIAARSKAAACSDALTLSRFRSSPAP